MARIGKILKVYGRVSACMRYSNNKKFMKEILMGITKPAIRRLARIDGVKRLSSLIYEETR